MKKLLLLFYITSISNAYAQVKITTQVDTSLYVGVDNIVTITSEKIPLDQLKLQTKGCIVKGKTGTVNVLCLKPARNIILEVVHKNKVVASKIINVNMISDPVAYVLGEKLFTDSLITKKQLLTAKILKVKLNYPLASFPVISFTTEIIHEGKSSGILRGSGNIISNDIKTMLAMAMPGDEIVFDQIRVECPDSSKKFVPPVKLKITE
jgi:hypothetical protein